MLKRFKIKIVYFCILIFIFVLTVFFLRHSYREIAGAHNHEIQNHYFHNLSNFSLRGIQNETNLFDISNFTFLIKPKEDFCYNSEVNHVIEGVFIVTSYISNIETRSAMRRAFTEHDLKQLGIRRVFLLGITLDNKYINQRAIQDEAKRYGDIVQGNFHEAYRNLTYKHVMGLMWVNRYCEKSQFVIKMDDDIVINLLKLLDLMKKFDSKEDFISGYLLKGLQVKRIEANKWFVTKEEYPLEIYPQFVSGWLYITTPSVCEKLLQLVDENKYFWIDDVFITGILAEKIHVKMYDIKEFFTDHPEYFQCCLNDYERDRLDCDIIVGPNGGRTNLFYEFNKVFSHCKSTGCTERLYRVNESCTKSSGKYDLSKGNAVISSYKLVR